MKGKDFNLFEVYKSGPSKPADTGVKAILATVLVFVMLVVGVYSLIMFIMSNTQSKINTLNSQINSPQAIEANAKLATQLKKNQLMKDYNNALTQAKSNFDSSRIIDSVLLNKIISSTPTGAIMRSMTINPKSIELSYVSPDRMAPAIFTQSLNKLDIFAKISYNSVSLDSGNAAAGANVAQAKNYTFTLLCEFKEVPAK